ncbi:MAG: exodeoxyribonuclease VII small subunit [Chloroflexota bacterium]
MDDQAEPSLESLISQWELVLDTGSFEETLRALEQIVQRLEEGCVSLESALRCYELGVRMARRCEMMLDEAELRITRLDDMDDMDPRDGSLDTPHAERA